MASQDGRRSAAARGYDGRWRKESKSFLALNPWCALKGDRCGLIATLVDHVQPHRNDMSLFWNRANWQPLCAHCHNVHKQRIETGRGEVKRDRRGRLIVDA